MSYFLPWAVKLFIYVHSMHFSYECSTSTIQKAMSITGKKHVERDDGRQRGTTCAPGGL